MAFAKVDGILLNNNKIRNEMLRRVYWKDKQYTDFGGDFVRNVNIETKSVSPKGEGRDLLTYTFNTDTNFSRETLKRYLGNEIEHEFYEVKPIPDGKRFKWLGNYVEKFDPNTILKRVGEVKLAEGEMRNNFSNESRFLEEKYLTPGLLNFYGNKFNADLIIAQNAILGNLDGFIHVGEGRLADIAEANVEIVHDFNEVIDSPKKFNGAGFKYLQEQLEKSNNRRYIDFITHDFDRSDEDTINYFPKHQGRGIIDNYDKDFSQKTFYKNNFGEIYTTYDEGDKENNNDTSHTITNGIDDNNEIFVTPTIKTKSLLTKTNNLFNQHKISTMIGRFHTTLSDEGVDKESTIIDSTVRKGIGNSKGRNLLKKESTSINGYDNPYCRVWTYHYQYDKVSKLIRPFGANEDIRQYNPYQTTYSNGEGGVDDGLNGRDYLRKNTVLDSTGFVKIAPKKDGCNGVTSVKIKECMFSIENLAWKDVPRKAGEGMEEYYISEEQRGPNGGRIMWFPPYDLNFQESVNVNWNSYNFIGRGEPVFTYSNTTRNGVLSFVILVDHPAIIDNIGKNNLKSEQLSDDDILRYFAGCDIPEGFTDTSECEIEEKETESKKPDEEPKQQLNKTKSKHIKFNVFFPNNYSGNGIAIPKEDWKQNGSSDRLWYEYLLFGKNTEISDTIPGYGYETHISENGISVNGSTEGINPALITRPWHVGTGISNDNYYQYRVDFDLRQVLTNRDLKGNKRASFKDSNYTDSSSFGLNVSLTNQNNEPTNTFSQILLTMVDSEMVDFNEMLVDNIESLVDSGFKDSDNYNELVDLFKNSYERIKEVKITGFASNQDKKNSSLLAKRRCESLHGLVKQFVSKDVKIQKTVKELPDLKNPTDNNSLEAKLQKCATCEIWYDVPEIVDVSDTTEQIQDKKEERNENKTGKQEQKTTFAAKTEKVYPTRYETEAEYFKNIDREDPLIYKRIIDKFKYFNPAFHSISPEGFNARLTFLQQCTRQGHTIEATSKDFAQTAGNLAFGRMPVCVLRLGDFINTKILINGMSFNFDANGPMQWDLNPEGIGVQPMYAKISLQITILGGQSLEGPINRLQNAVTFNYYANTGVYDNRSDRISLGDESTVTNNSNTVKENTKETSGDKYNNSKGSDDMNTKLTYRHVFITEPNKKS